jgi:hypothetical protein
MKVLLYNKPRSERLKKAGVLSGECVYLLLYIYYIYFVFNSQGFSISLASLFCFSVCFLQLLVNLSDILLLYLYIFPGPLSFRRSRDGL